MTGSPIITKSVRGTPTFPIAAQLANWVRGSKTGTVAVGGYPVAGYASTYDANIMQVSFNSKRGAYRSSQVRSPEDWQQGNPSYLPFHLPDHDSWLHRRPYFYYCGLVRIWG